MPGAVIGLCSPYKEHFYLLLILFYFYLQFCQLVISTHLFPLLKCVVYQNMYALFVRL